MARGFLQAGRQGAVNGEVAAEAILMCKMVDREVEVKKESVEK